MHAYILVKYETFFRACDFCSIQHFILTFTKFNKSDFHFSFKVLLLLPKFSLNYEGRPTRFTDQALQKFHKQLINGVVIMFFH